MNLETQYTILESTEEEQNFVDQQIIKYNFGKVPFTQNEPFIKMGFISKDSNGSLLGGINFLIYCWNIFYIDILWVEKQNRNTGTGSHLLSKVESEAKKRNCHLIHLDTFDFQAKDFYLKKGYEVFGKLEDCPKGHTRFYMKKTIG